MKIGIITWFKYENYGTALQAIALQKYLRTRGFDVELINYTIEEKRRRNIFEKFFSRLILKINKIIYKKSFIKKSEDFKKIIYDNCNVTQEVKTKEEYIKICNTYDVIIFGSDQIWNPDVYHAFYFANFSEIKCKRVAYAPSFGMNHIPETKKQEIKEALERFSNISVRENEGCQIVKDLISKDVSTVVDPTLLLTKNEWGKLEEPLDICNEDYILCYFLSDNIYHWKAAKKFAKQKKLKLVLIPHDGLSYVKSKYTIRNCNVGNFLSLIKNAKYVITDSFHGSIFSIIYEKQFILFERHNPMDKLSQNSRLYNLLNILGLEKVLLKYGTNSIKEDENIDYFDVKEKLEFLIEDSKEYLKKSIC